MTVIPFAPAEGTFRSILPYLEAGNTLPQTLGPPPPHVPAYISPIDPTFNANAGDGVIYGNASYAANAQVFRPGYRLPESIPDGMSATIAFGERYARCRATDADWNTPVVTGGGAFPEGPPLRRATFADPVIVFDVVPMTTAAAGTRASVPGLTFQLRPAQQACDYRVLQSPHPGGLPVALMDGSVRTLHPTISEAVFWSAVTPDGGEVLAGW